MRSMAVRPKRRSRLRCWAGVSSSSKTTVSASRLSAQGGDLRRLSPPHEGRGVRRLSSLHHSPDDVGSRAVDQLGQLVELLGDRLGRAAREHHPHQDDPLPDRAGDERPRQQAAQESSPGWMSTSATLRTGPARNVLTAPPSSAASPRVTVSIPPGLRTRTSAPPDTTAPAARRRRRRHAPGPAGERLAHPAFEDPELEQLTCLVTAHGDPLDVDPAGESGLELGSQLDHVDRGRVGPEQHEVRISDVDGARPAVVELLGLVGTQARRTHVDPGRRPSGLRHRACTRRCASRPQWPP